MMFSLTPRGSWLAAHVTLVFALNTIKKILIRYTAWLLKVLAALGPWGVFAIAAVDGSLLGMPVDWVVAEYVYNHRSHFLFYVLMASAGSTLGSLVIYAIGYFGGETVLRKRITEERFNKIHASFERHEFWAVMFPAMLPAHALQAVRARRLSLRDALHAFSGCGVRRALCALLCTGDLDHQVRAPSRSYCRSAGEAAPGLAVGGRRAGVSGRVVDLEKSDTCEGKPGSGFKAWPISSAHLARRTVRKGRGREGSDFRGPTVRCVSRLQPLRFAFERLAIPTLGAKRRTSGAEALSLSAADWHD